MIVTGNPAEFTVNGVAATVNSLTVPFSPTQDLNGYSQPWPAGGGVNKLAPASIGKVNDSGITVTLTATELNGYEATKVEVTGTAVSWGWRLYQVGIRDIVQPSTAYRLTFIANAQYDLRWNLCSTASQNTLTGNQAFICTSIGGGLYQYSCEFTTVAADNAGWNYTNQVILLYSNPATLSPVTITIINNFCLTLQSDPEGWFPYSNICPISGRKGLSVYRTGKNLLPGSEYTTNSSGSTSHVVNVSGMIPKGTALTIRGYDAAGTAFDYTKCQIQFREGLVAQRSVSPNTTVTFANDVYYDNIMYYTTNALAGQTIKLQAELGSTATTYEPYNGNTYAVNWSTQAGTVYGGTLDVVTGVLTVDRAMVTLNGSESWAAHGQIVSWFYLDSVFDDSYVKADSKSFAISNKYVQNYYSFAAAFENGQFGIGLPTGGSHNRLVVKDTAYTTVAQFKSALETSPLQVCYKLATPLTYQLTPKTINLLAGITNYVWSDTDEDITISFDVAAFIRQLFRVNGVDFSRFVERDSYATSLEPVYAETIQTMDGVNHTALLRTRGSIRLRFNPQTDSDTAALCSALLASPCEVQYRCLQRDVDVTALMCVDTISAQFLSRCLYLGDEWNQIESITLTEL